MIVRPEAGNPTETPPLRHRWCSTGRLSVDVDVNPAVDHQRARSLGLLQEPAEFGQVLSPEVAVGSTRKRTLKAGVHQRDSLGS